MNRVEELIEKLCPDGVEFKKLNDCIPVQRGKRVVKVNLSSEPDGKYPVYQNCLIPLGYHDETNCPANSAFVIAAGAAGDLGFSVTDFWAADDCFYFISNDKIMAKYLYYILSSKQSVLKARVRKASVPRLPRNVLENMQIPAPPLEVQAEIVRILDNFTELEAELEARKQQYEYYRDLLLTFKPKEPKADGGTDKGAEI